MKLPQWSKLSNNNNKKPVYVVFFPPQSLKNNINTSEWTQMEQEEGTRKEQYNLATGWDISWEEKSKQARACNSSKHSCK